MCSKVFYTSSYVFDALEPNEVWVLEKGTGGFSTITQASDHDYVRQMAEEGQPLGGLWYRD